jgi:hypothetical protein
MRARDWPCPFSGRRADNGHHLSGRDADGRYLDPLLLLPLIRRQHHLEHQCWGWSFADGVVVDPNFLRLRRTGHLLVRLGEHHHGGVVVLPAETVRELGLMLHRVANDLAVTSLPKVGNK